MQATDFYCDYKPFNYIFYSFDTFCQNVCPPLQMSCFCTYFRIQVSSKFSDFYFDFSFSALQIFIEEVLETLYYRSQGYSGQNNDVFSANSSITGLLS